MKNHEFIIRVDDRLIHGQVIVGWVKALDLNNIIVANNKLLHDNLKMQMMKLAVPSDINVEFLKLEQAIKLYESGKWNNYKTILLVETPKDAFYILHNGCKLDKLNVGGLHVQNGRLPVTQNLAFNNEDREYLKKIIKIDVKIEGRALPSDEEYNVARFIEDKNAN